MASITIADHVLSTTRGFAKSDIRYWQGRVFHRVYKYRGFHRICRDFSLDLRANGRREGFNLGTSNKRIAAHKAREIYQQLKVNYWEEPTEIALTSLQGAAE
jgi:hypothetical protein